MRRRTGIASGAGFTLMEVIVVIVLIGVVARIALPKFNRLQRVMMMDRAATTVAGGLRRARSEAVARNGTVTFEPTTSPAGYQVRAGGVTLAQSALPSGVAWDGTPPQATFRSFGPLPSSQTYPLTFGLRASTGGDTRTVQLLSGGAIRLP